MPGYFKSMLATLAVLLACALPCAAASSDVASQSPTPGAVAYESDKTYTGEKISLEFKNTDVRDVIEVISQLSGKKIIVPDCVSGKLTLKLKDVPWDQALDIVLASRNLGYEESGDVLTVYDLANYGGCRLYPRSSRPDSPGPQLPPLTIKMFTPQYAPIAQVAEELKKHKSERGKIVAIGNDIYVEDDPGALAAMTQAFLRLERKAGEAPD